MSVNAECVVCGCHSTSLLDTFIEGYHVDGETFEFRACRDHIIEFGVIDVEDDGFESTQLDMAKLEGRGLVLVPEPDRWLFSICTHACFVGTGAHR